MIAPPPDIKTIDLPALVTHAWQLDHDPHLPEDTRYLIAETHPVTGATYAQLLISIRPGDYINLTNIDTSTALTEGFSRLLKAKHTGFGFFKRLEVKLILARINEKSTRVKSSGHFYGITDKGLVIDPPDKPTVPNTYDVLLHRDVRLLSVDLRVRALPNRASAAEITGVLPPVTDPVLDDQIELSSFVTTHPIYSKTLVVRGRGADGRSHLILAKQTRAHFSKTDIDIISGAGSTFSHYTKFEKTTGYETLSIYHDPR